MSEFVAENGMQPKYVLVWTKGEEMVHLAHPDRQGVLTISYAALVDLMLQAGWHADGQEPAGELW